MKLRAHHLAILPLLSMGLACGGTNDESVGVGEDEQIAATFCVKTKAISEDGYSELLEADPAKAKLAKPVAPTAEQVKAASQKIFAHVSNIRGIDPSKRRKEIFSAKRSGQFSEPYCLFHEANKKVYGTVVLFHGFNDRPLQQSKLASYLFHSGFDVYNVHLAYHYLVPGTAHWPRTVYRDDVLKATADKLEAAKSDPKFAPIFAKIALKFSEGKTPSAADFSAEDFAQINAVLSAGPNPVTTKTLADAWADPTSDAFKQLFKTAPQGPQPTSADLLLAAAQAADYMAFVTEARARISEVKGLGPVFLGGLSVGGTVALAAAADDGGTNVKGTMAHAPWLKSVDANNNSQTSMLAPLDSRINNLKAGSYPMKWGNHQIEFSPASIAADLALGSWTAGKAAKLVPIPTAMIVTDAELSADNAASGQLNAALVANAQGKVPHVRAAYPASDKVGHALTDPENYTKENEDPENKEHWNTRWRQLYQESFRFYTNGTISQENLLRADATIQDPSLPQVRCAAAEWDKGERCTASEPRK